MCLARFLELLEAYGGAGPAQRHCISIDDARTNRIPWEECEIG